MSRRAAGMARSALGTALLLAASACVPYTVSTTAQPVAKDSTASTLVAYAMPKIGRIDSSRFSNSAPVSLLAVDYEWRRGLDERSDFGIRFPSASGVVANYKRLLTEADSGMRSAILAGAGLVNLGQHAHFELSWVISGWEPAANAPGRVRPPAVVPYGGVRLMQVVPVVEDALHDRPTIGAFVGVRIGRVDLGISPEIGVFYDHSALGVRRQSVVVVPAIALHGDHLINALRGGRGRGRLPGPPW